MHSKSAYGMCLAILSTFSTSALSHSGHTTAPHIHNLMEFSLLAIVIGFIIYHIIKS